MFIIQNNKLMRLVTALAGLAGCVTVGVGLYQASAHYIGDGNYSPQNHFISELGMGNATSMAYFFNRSLIVAGLLLMIFVIGLGRFIGNGGAARAAIVFGIIATVHFAAVGYFTAADWIHHMIAASVFFVGAMIAITLFTIAIWRDEQKRLHPVHIIHGLLIATWYFVALLWPKTSLWQMQSNPVHFVRPAFWMLTVLEWGYCLLICTWICMVSLNLLYNLALESNLNVFRSRHQLYQEYSQRLQHAKTWIERNLKQQGRD